MNLPEPRPHLDSEIPHRHQESLAFAKCFQRSNKFGKHSCNLGFSTLRTAYWNLWGRLLRIMCPGHRPHLKPELESGRREDGASGGLIKAPWIISLSPSQRVWSNGSKVRPRNLYFRKHLPLPLPLLSNHNSLHLIQRSISLRPSLLSVARRPTALEFPRSLL